MLITLSSSISLLFTSFIKQIVNQILFNRIDTKIKYVLRLDFHISNHLSLYAYLVEAFIIILFIIIWNIGYKVLKSYKFYKKNK